MPLVLFKSYNLMRYLVIKDLVQCLSIMLEEKLDGNLTRMQCTVLNKSWK